MINKKSCIKHKLNKNLTNDAVSSIVSVMFVLMIFFASTGAVLFWGPQYITSEENKRSSQSTSIQFSSLSEFYKSLGLNGTSYNSNIVLNGGTMNVDSKGEKLIVLYSLNQEYDYNVILDDNDPRIFSINMLNGNLSYVLLNKLSDTCFLAGTKISMADGSFRNIEDIKSGDLVKSFDVFSGRFVGARVKSLLCYGKERMGSDYYLVINDELRVTPNHKLFVDNKWVEAGSLKVGDVGLDVSGSMVSFGSLVKVFSREPSFDLLLVSGGTYFADGFLVKSDVEMINIKSVSSNPIKLAPLGAEYQPDPWHEYPKEIKIFANKDTRLSEFHPNKNYGDSVLIVDPKYIKLVAEQRDRILVNMRFDENVIPEYSLINTAQVNLFYYGYNDQNPKERFHQIYECAGLWFEFAASWESDYDNFRETNPGEISYVVVPDEVYSYLTWDVATSIQSFVGWVQVIPGNPWDLIDHSPRYSDYFGWLIKDKDNGTYLSYNAHYSSREWPETFRDPYMFVKFINPPIIENEEMEILNISNHNANLSAYLSDDGGDSTGTSCYFKYGYSPSMSLTSSTFTNRFDFGNSAVIRIPVNNLNSGDLIYYRAWANNDAYKSGRADSYKKFITIPPAPSFVYAIPHSSSIDLSWDDAAVEGEGQTTYYKVLCKKDPFNSDDEYLVDLSDDTAPGNPNIQIYFGVETSHTFDNLDSNTMYYFRVYTFVTEGGLWQRSRDYASCSAYTAFNNPPNTPSKPSGPEIINASTPGRYETVTTDPDGDKVSYLFDWGDAPPSIDDWTEYFPSEKPVKIYKAWSSPGTYEVKAMASDIKGATSGWSPGLTVTVNPSPGNPPEKPSLTGPTARLANEPGTYEAHTKDPDDDQIYYLFDWDDGTDSWLGPYDSGKEVQTTHDWDTAGVYDVSVQAFDNKSSASELSDSLSVNVTGISIPEPPKLLYSNYYNATKYNFTIVATEDESLYMFDFGNGEKEPWIGHYAKGAIVTAEHIWMDKGVYEIKVKVKANNIESRWSDPVAIKVRYKYIIPSDTEGDVEKLLPVQVISNSYRFEANTDLGSAMCIQLFSNEYPNVADSEDKGNVSFGSIWIFDLGSITHSFGSSSGEYKTILEDSSVLSVSPSAGTNINSYSNINARDNILSYTVTMIRKGMVDSFTGTGTVGLSFTKLNNLVREQQEYNVYHFKVKYSGDYSTYLHKYLENNYKFTSGSDDFLEYDGGSAKQLIFSTNLLRVNIG